MKTSHSVSLKTIGEGGAEDRRGLQAGDAVNLSLMEGGRNPLCLHLVWDCQLTCWPGESTRGARGF